MRVTVGQHWEDDVFKRRDAPMWVEAWRRKRCSDFCQRSLWWRHSIVPPPAAGPGLRLRVWVMEAQQNVLTIWADVTVSGCSSCLKLLIKDRRERHSLKARGVEKVSCGSFTLGDLGWDVFSQSNTGTAAKTTVGRLLRDGTQRIWAFPGATMLYLARTGNWKKHSVQNLLRLQTSGKDVHRCFRNSVKWKRQLVSLDKRLEVPMRVEAWGRKCCSNFCQQSLRWRHSIVPG